MHKGSVVGDFGLYRWFKSNWSQNYMLISPAWSDCHQWKKCPEPCVYKYSWQLHPGPCPRLAFQTISHCFLLITYTQLIKRVKPTVQTVKVWTDESTAALQDCFESTDWQMFRDAATQDNSINLEEYTTSVTSHISKCVDDVVITKSKWDNYPTERLE